LQLAEFLEMEGQRLLILKPSPIGNHGRLLDAHIDTHHRRRRGRALFLDIYLNRHVPLPCFTGDCCPQDFDSFAANLLALVALFGWLWRFSLLDKAQFFREIDGSQGAKESCSPLLKLALLQDKSAQARDRDPMTAQGEFIIGEIKGFVGFPFFLECGVLSSTGEEVGVGVAQIIEGPLDDTFRHVIGPGELLLPDRVELLLEF